MITQKDINKDNLIPTGSMNLTMQIWGNINGEDQQWNGDIYQPRKNRVYNGDLEDKETLINSVKDTIERLKIGQQLLQDWLDGKIDDVYYWDIDKLSE